MKVSVVIVNWNGKGYLQTSLPSLSKQTYADYEIILVDNGSSDGSVDFAEGQVRFFLYKPRRGSANAAASRGSALITWASSSLV